MIVNDEKIYNDTVEIVKAAASSGHDNVICDVETFMQEVYNALCKINQQGDSSLPLPI